MTWTDNRGRRMRLWIPAEVGTIADPQEFMETLVDRAVGILEREPIDIYVNPTFLPDSDRQRLRPAVDRRRIRKVVTRGGAERQWPSRSTTAIAALRRSANGQGRPGCKFTFGTNNAGPTTLGAASTALQMVEACKLGWQDFFVPGAWGPKAVDRKPEALARG